MTRVHAGLVAVAMVLFLACGGSVIDGGEGLTPQAQGGSASGGSAGAGGGTDSGTGGLDGTGGTSAIDGGSVDAALAGCTLEGPQFDPANLGEAEQLLVGVWLTCAGKQLGCDGLSFQGDHTWKCVIYDGQGHPVLDDKYPQHAGSWKLESDYQLDMMLGGGAGGPNGPVIFRKSPRRLTFNYDLYVAYP